MDALIAVGATASIAWSLYAMFIMADQAQPRVRSTRP